jgi:hypothetical protein
MMGEPESTSGGVTLRGPLFQPAKTEWRESIVAQKGTGGPGKPGGHYNIFAAADDRAMEFLRWLFPDARANEFNLVLFSTSGVHGTYMTIEEAHDEWLEHKEHDEEAVEVTFLLVQPRIVSMTCGNCRPTSPEDFEFLKHLRQSSWEVFQEIGADKLKEEDNR